jgi:predicted  nucleic acid-binding Zn-ribbon protein
MTDQLGPETLRAWRDDPSVRGNLTDDENDALDAHAAAWRADIRLCRDEIKRADDRFDKLQDEWREQRNTIVTLRKRLEEAMDPNRMAAIIRAVDGNHLLGAGALAEAICAALRKRMEMSEEGGALAEALVLSHEGRIETLESRLTLYEEIARAAGIDLAQSAASTEAMRHPEGTWVPHVVEEGSREHVTHWDSMGSHCSEPLCEVNRPSEEKKMTETKLDDIVGHTTKGIVPNPLFALAEKLMASDKDFYWVIEQLNSAKYVWQAERVQTAEREAAYAELKALLDELGPKTDDLLAEAKHLRAEAPDLVHARDLLAQALSRFAQKDKALRFALDNLREIAIPMADAARRVTSLNHAQRMIEEALGLDPQVCVWTYDHRDDMWNTACGECFVFEDGTPLQNNHKFCGYCGKPLTESLGNDPTPTKEG